MPSKHKYNLKDAKPQFESKLGSIHRVTATELPILQNLSMKRLVLKPNAIREPHWHANCEELTYVIEGKVLVSILDTGSKFANVTLEAGEMVHINSGSLHHIENVADTDAVILICFRHEQPKDFSMSASFGAMSDAVLGNTYDVDSSVFSKMPQRDTKEKYLVERKGKPTIPSTAHLPDPHKFSVEEMQPPTFKEGVGSAKKARSQYWPILKNIAMYSLRVEDKAMREPHWHPQTVEMGYVHKGKARMTIMDPNGDLDTYLLSPGECYFIPASYPHQIEVIGDEQIHFLIFFDQAMPQDVGYRQSTIAMSKEVIAATLGVDEKMLPEFPYEMEDPLLVGKKNKTDPVKSKL